MNLAEIEINDAIEQLVEQQAAVAVKHLTTAPDVKAQGACLVARGGGPHPNFTFVCLPVVALRALAWVMAEERRVVIYEANELASSLGSINDAELTQDDALWFLSRAQTLLEKLRETAGDADSPGGAE